MPGTDDPTRDPRELLPLSNPMYYVLLALGDEALHGYGIMQAFEADTDGEETLLPGTLYATIARMVEAGLIEELPEPPEDSTDRRRRYYRATSFGREVARLESERLARLLELARRQGLAAGSAERSR